MVHFEEIHLEPICHNEAGYRFYGTYYVHSGSKLLPITRMYGIGDSYFKRYERYDGDYHGLCPVPLFKCDDLDLAKQQIIEAVQTNNELVSPKYILIRYLDMVGLACGR